ncbi:MAG: ABC transporter ATP-binding protein [Rhodospirillales bacterium]|nr:ABC transporter ATP-binding protein [Rhodospirillales bacterium]
MRVLEVRGLHKRFSGVHAVRNVDFEVESGELLGLFGPNGAGKTTVFNLVAGTLYPDAGEIRLHGNEITRLPAFRRARLGIGRTFQIVRPFRSLTVLENVLAVVPSGADGAGAAQGDSPYALLDKVGLAGRADDLAGELTLGMLKRLEVARALALQPRLLLLDEPLAGLTSGEAAELLAFIGTLRSRLSIVMVEHNVRLALPICDRAVVMDAGAVIAAGSPEAVRTNPEVVRAYLGEDAG